MKKIFLHIGFPKTGTTSIQYFLNQNTAELKKHNFAYPSFDQPDFIPNGRSILTSEIHNPNWSKKIQSNWENMTSIIENLDVNNIIISEEGFSILQNTKIWIDLRIKDLFEVTVICYYRRAIDYLATSYAQNTPSGNWKNTLDLLEFIDRSTFIEDGVKKLHEYADIFGRENIVLKPFDKTSFVEGDLIKDFMNILGISNIENFSPSTKENPSYNRNEVEICRILNKTGLNHLFHSMVLSNNTKPKIIETISDEIIQKYVDKYHSIECKLAKDFLDKEELFSSKYPEIYGKPREPYTGISNEVMLEFLIKYINYKADNQCNNINSSKKILKNARRRLFQLRWNKTEKVIRIFGKTLYKHNI